jgi:hypothetical protein
MDVIEKIARADNEDEAWDVMRDFDDCFIWTDDESPDVRWNEIAEKYGIADRISLSWNTKPILRRGEVEVAVDIVYTRDDSFIVIHALAILGKDALEVRYCNASHHSSDKAYAAAPPAVWKLIEAGVMAEGIRQQFLSLPGNIKEFAKLLYAPYPLPDWVAT